MVRTLQRKARRGEPTGSFGSSASYLQSRHATDRLVASVVGIVQTHLNATKTSFCSHVTTMVDDRTARVGCIGLCGVQRVVRCIAADWIKDVVVAFVLLVEAEFG